MGGAERHSGTSSMGRVITRYYESPCAFARKKGAMLRTVIIIPRDSWHWQYECIHLNRTYLGLYVRGIVGNCNHLEFIRA
jgi:hypothetical protein